MKATAQITLWAAAAALAGCSGFFDRFCDEPGCEFSRAQWDNLSALANLPPPPPDPANKYDGDPRAQTLGHQLYFDTRFSGAATEVDVLGRSMAFPARAPKGQQIKIACATCHDLRRAGTDPSPFPGNVSVGAGLYDVNAPSTINSAYYELKYWNGRYDSLVWQIVAVAESGVSMNGNRLKTAWLLSDLYQATFSAIFTDHPLPDFGHSRAEQAALVQPDGSCITATGGSPPCPPGCVAETGASGVSACWPRFPLDGKPGKTPGCQRGAASEPFGDAFDCMADDDQKVVTRAYVNYAKAIAAFEYTLVSRESPFDRWIRAGPGSELISASARRGARLFVSKGGCLECHGTPLFSDNQFHNIGVPQVGVGVPTEADCNPLKAASTCQALGWYVGLAAMNSPAGKMFRIDSSYSDNPSDRSRQKYYELQQDPSMKGSWRTPSLRDVALTAPYMHNGVYRTLEDVIWHYDSGGTSAGVAPAEMAKQIRPLGLSASEVADLVEFLRTLTGDPLPCAITMDPNPGASSCDGGVPPLP
jgi:cytochrome c peroxidase